MDLPRRTTWLLLLALALVASYLNRTSEDPRLELVQQSPPPVQAPTGPLAAAFDVAREASVRIEARCMGATRGPTLGVGSGFFFSTDGMVLTAYHVVDPSASTNSICPLRQGYVAITSTNEEFPLTLVGFDAYMDLAALQAAVPRAVAAIPLAATLPTPGAAVVAIGNSRNEFLAARAGRVTRLGVQAGRVSFASDTIELTNSLAPGDSGGPVINSRGEAVGVVSYISFNPTAMSSQGYVPPFLSGLVLPRDFASYAVPVTRYSELVSAIAGGEKRDIPVIGFSADPGLQDYDPATGAYNLGSRPGAIVRFVQAGGPAAQAGLRSMEEVRIVGENGADSVRLVADVIVAIDDEATPTFYELQAVVRSKAIGQVVTLTVQRGDVTVRLELTLGARRSVFAGG